MSPAVTETSRVLSEFVTILEDLSIDYFLTGSLASGIRGEFRATNDIDIVAQLKQTEVKKFVELCSKGFFANELSIKNALLEKRSFNIIHKELVMKVDVFSNIDELASQQIKRATALNIPGTDKQVIVASSEDVIISKLIWYKKGNLQSERQWRDILGVIAISGKNLDLEYINRWCAKLVLKELFDKAINQVHSK